MIALRPFFLLLGRASVFWLGAIGLFVVSMFVAGVAQPDERLRWYLDPVFIAAFAFPGCAGWLAGAVIQEFQHTSFAAVLPGVRFRIASGFLAAGLAATAIVVGAIALNSPTPWMLPVLFFVGLAAYCLGGILIDPLSDWITSLNVVVALLILARSRDAARLAADHPWMTILVSVAVGTACVLRLFARATFRRKPFCQTSPLPGRFALEKTRQTVRQRVVRDRPNRTGWRAGYLGSDASRWVRAAVHEVYGALGWKAAWRVVSRAWGLIGLVLCYAWVDKGDMGFGEALARSINDALLRSPHHPQFGEHGGPFPIVIIAIAAAGAVTALFSPVALHGMMAYPLSRRRRAEVLFRGGLVDAAIFLFIVGPCLFIAGQLAGWLVGYEVRFDFMPFFFRALLVTLILMPLAHWGRLRLHAAMRQRAENTLLAVIVGVCGFVIAVGVWTFVSPRLFVSPAGELAVLALALLGSQLIYRRTLTTYYRTADLA